MRLKWPSKRAFLLGFLLLAIVLAALPHRWTEPPRTYLISLLRPAQKYAQQGAQSLSSLWTDLSKRRDLGAENRALQERIAALENRLVRMTEEWSRIGEKEKNLDALFNLPTRLRALPADLTGGKRLAAGVLGADSSNWRRSVVIDRGAEDGVAEGQAVIWQNAVVGVVVGAGPRASRVALLEDPQCRVAASDVRSREQGVVEGTGAAVCRLKHVPRDKDVRKGDLLVTSGLEGVFPRSLLIGQVVESECASSGLFREIKVQPRVQFSRLESVLVLVEGGPAAPQPKPAPPPPPHTKRKGR